MSLKILLAFDDSENAFRAVETIAKMYSRDCRITLLTVLQDSAVLCDLHSPELTEYFQSQQTAFCLLEDKKKELVSAAQKKAKNILIEAGFDSEKIKLETRGKKKGVARDIVQEATAGYDLVVVGRRGLSSIKEFFLGSISQKILSLTKDIPVLVVN